jgi:predicted enzyme related to lactoylglutathione lyase
MRTLKGLYHLAFSVDDINALTTRLEEHKVKSVLPPSQFRPDWKIACIEDPEGVHIQLIEYLR